jgi:hypothetical protein
VTAIAPYRKTLVAVIGALVSWVAMTYTGDWVALTTMLATALGVYGVVNEEI